jgi:hypothetical protein
VRAQSMRARRCSCGRRPRAGVLRCGKGAHARGAVRLFPLTAASRTPWARAAGCQRFSRRARAGCRPPRPRWGRRRGTGGEPRWMRGAAAAATPSSPPPARRDPDPGPARPDPAAPGRDPAVDVAGGACLQGPDSAPARPDTVARDWIRWLPWPTERRRGEIRAQAAGAPVARLPGAAVGARRGLPSITENCAATREAALSSPCESSLYHG